MAYFVLGLIAILSVLAFQGDAAGILYPRNSETRNSITLDGFWDFSLGDSANPHRGYTEQWYNKSLRAIDDLAVDLMAVPASYNDISTDWTVRDYYGLAWYQRDFVVPKSWTGNRVVIRFGSVCREAEVFINGQSVTRHTIGHLAFEADITSNVNFGQINHVTVSVDNTLLAATIPQGSITTIESGRTINTYTFDFFNYAGIDRSVVLYSTPLDYIDDVTLTTDVDGAGNGIVNYQVNIAGYLTNVRFAVLDVDGVEVASYQSNGDNQQTGSITVPNARLWWPYLMDPNPGYLYRFQMATHGDNNVLTDKYLQPFGFRTLSWDANSFKINNRPVYMRGFGKHEDSDIRGKGFDHALWMRDFNLIKWIGANSFRTSHYPYAEEIMELADQLGIMVIDESPAVNTENYSDELLDNHRLSLTELYNRDKNRPSVVIWSAANEPRTQYEESEDYYRQVVAHIKGLDSTRPVTVVNNQQPDSEHSGQFIDIASFNIYKAWYEDAGDLDVIIPAVERVARRWHELHNIPVIITEYGGDTQEGMHQIPAHIWSEEFQVGILSNHFQAFDQLRSENFFIGEMIWNFADFKTAQTLRRVGGNKKGIFTRERQPKAAAHLMRKRYWMLAQDLDGVSYPGDVWDYVYTDTWA